MSAGPERVHLVGIGGMHMSAIAQLLIAEGARVSGSDLMPSHLTRRLEALGARVHIGHDASNVSDATLVVTTAAAKSDNVELVEARRRGIPLLARHEMVARLMKGRVGVAVAGTHGKTTTSSLLAFMLHRAGYDPAYLLGGESLDLGGNASPGGGRHIVVEADEYAGAFLAYHPTVAVITNVELDHLDYYPTQADLIRAFRGFACNTVPGGTIVACADSLLLRNLLQEGAPPASTVSWYGLGNGLEWQARDVQLHERGGSEFTIALRGDVVARASLAVPGRHNVSNALAAFAAGHFLGLDRQEMIETLGLFRGARRRFELVGEVNGISVIDDYAHHPTEIRATLAAARGRFPARRLIVLFQPHTYSRTRYLLDEFRCCFVEADELFFMQTFAARETAEAGLDAHALAREVEKRPAGFAENASEAVHLVAAHLRPGDVVFTMGAGDVTSVGPPLIEELARR